MDFKIIMLSKRNQAKNQYVIYDPTLENANQTTGGQNESEADRGQEKDGQKRGLKKVQGNF